MFPLAAVRTPAAPMATEAFVRTWARIDQPVAAGGERTVQLFDKSRMEDNSW
jgi:hypothetical protein